MAEALPQGAKPKGKSKGKGKGKAKPRVKLPVFHDDWPGIEFYVPDEPEFVAQQSSDEEQDLNPAAAEERALRKKERAKKRQQQAQQVREVCRNVEIMLRALAEECLEPTGRTPVDRVRFFASTYRSAENAVAQLVEITQQLAAWSGRADDHELLILVKELKDRMTGHYTTQILTHILSSASKRKEAREAMVKSHQDLLDYNREAGAYGQAVAEMGPVGDTPLDTPPEHPQALADPTAVFDDIVLLEAFKYLSLKDLVNVGQVNQRWRDLSKVKSLWSAGKVTTGDMPTNDFMRILKAAPCLDDVGVYAVQNNIVGGAIASSTCKIKVLSLRGCWEQPWQADLLRSQAPQLEQLRTDNLTPECWSVVDTMKKLHTL